MTDPFSFDDPFVPVPPAAVDADPAATIRELFYRVARLEQGLEESHVQAGADLGEVLLDLVSLSDDIRRIVERWGIATNAQEAALVRSVVALGRKLNAILDHHEVRPVNTIGQALDPKTSDVVEVDARDNIAPNMVLREVQMGYAWRHGLLRRAKVAVSGPVDSTSDETEDGEQATEATA
jgi:molecular chaperone GrpE (heat shock protein)